MNTDRTTEVESNMEFVEFPKIARLSREVIITEKIDGTNGQILIQPAVGERDHALDSVTWINDVPHFIRAGSRNRWVPFEGDDNFGFGRWVREHSLELAGLGVGRHFGEWWGSGIQRRYGLQEKRWSLFNVSRWTDSRPACCHVVPVLWRGIGFGAVGDSLHRLSELGSVAAPGFMDPEGIVAYHVQGNLSFKKTLKKDEEYKGKARA